MSERLIEARGLSAGYGEMAVVREIDLHVDAGEIGRASCRERVSECV